MGFVGLVGGFTGWAGGIHRVGRVGFIGWLLGIHMVGDGIQRVGGWDSQGERMGFKGWAGGIQRVGRWDS